MVVIFLLQIFAGGIGFANKVFLLLGKRTGWFLGFLAGVLFVAYFFSIHLYIFSTVQVGFTALMFYGYISNGNVSIRLRKTITIILSIIAIFLASAIFKGHLTIIESVSVLLAVWGTYFLVLKKYNYGWIMYFISHITSAYLTFLKDQYIFVFFQIASAVIAILGICKFCKKYR